MFLNSRKKQTGIGLLELMLSLAIIAVLIIMATRYYQSTRQSQLVSEGVGQVNAIVAAVGNWRVGVSGYTASGSGGSLSYSTLFKQGYLPQVWGTDSSTASPWGGALEVAGASTTSYTISYSSLPSYACYAMEQRLSNTESITPSCGGTSLTITYDESIGTTTS